MNPVENPTQSDAGEGLKAARRVMGRARRQTSIVVNGPSSEEWHALVRRAIFSGQGGTLAEITNSGLKLLDDIRLNEFFNLSERYLNQKGQRRGQITASREHEQLIETMAARHKMTPRDILIVATAHGALDILRKRSIMSFNFIAEMLRTNWEDPAIRARVIQQRSESEEAIDHVVQQIGTKKAGFDDGTALPEITKLINDMGYNALAILHAANESAGPEEFMARTAMARNTPSAK